MLDILQHLLVVAICFYVGLIYGKIYRQRMDDLEAKRQKMLERHEKERAELREYRQEIMEYLRRNVRDK